MAKKIYVCTNITASDIAYKKSDVCGVDADNVQDALDIMCQNLNNKVKDKYYTETWWEPFDTWVVHHNLDKMVSVTLEDLDGNDMEGDVEYFEDDQNTVVVHFSQPVSGRIYVN